MSALVDDIIRERRRGGGDQTQKDLLNFMLAGVDRQTGESLSDENIRYQIITFLIAGHETTSGLLSFTLYFLVNDPAVLARAYEEVDRVLGNDTGVMPTVQQINRLTYLQQILNEALRLYPTAPAIGLYPYKDEVIGGKYRLKKGTFVTLLTLMLHRDPTVWGPEPEKFNPDNFSREAEAKRPPNAFKPWGNGRRACIGRQFAMQEATLVLGMLLQRFQLFDHKNYQLKIKESLSIKPDGFTIKVKPRPGRVHSVAVPGAATAGSQSQAAPAAAARPSHGTPLTVLYGSNLGATEEIARDIAQAGELAGFATTLGELDAYAGRLPSEGAVVIASASYNGAPPDNATRFVDWLRSAGPDAGKGVNYTVFGCGNRDWASTFQATPRFIDERMEAIGARRIASRGEGDAREDLDGQFQSWLSNLLPQVAEALNLDLDLSMQSEAEPLYTVEVLSGEGTHRAAAQAGAHPGRILVNRELQQREGPTGSGRSTRHIEVELPAGMSYRPGDHLCVLPVNPPELVDRVMRRFGFQAGTRLRLSTTEGRQNPLGLEGEVSAEHILRDLVELQAVATRRHIEAMAAHTRCPATRPLLEALAGDGDGGYMEAVFAKRLSVLDLLEAHPACELPSGIFLEMLPMMAPRYYSISSSPNALPGRAAITVGVVQGPARSGAGVYKGVCSCHLSACPVGTTINVSVKETKAGFRLPSDPARPIIMVGPGTGLAPFRAFLQERSIQQRGGAALGPAMLFFGCRHPDQDFIYRDELDGFARDGIVELHVAFSRLDGSKTYVQDLIVRERARIWPLIRDGAIIYVCGDGSRMEPDVKRAITGIAGQELGLSTDQAADWMEQMTGSDRYVLDVWAGS